MTQGIKLSDKEITQKDEIGDISIEDIVKRSRMLEYNPPMTAPLVELI